jgi:dTDP-4-amino-4,6-dideoxygalactose transaminase
MTNISRSNLKLISRLKASSTAVSLSAAEVRSFEEEFARFCEVHACVGEGNGTDAIYLALRTLGIGKGDEVITVSHTFIATTEGITQTGATPVFIDVKEDTMLMTRHLSKARSRHEQGRSLRFIFTANPARWIQSSISLDDTI